MVVGGLGQEEQEDFLPDFEEYMEERELNYSRLENSDNLPGFKAWVFWNRQDDDLTLSYDHSVDSIPDVCASPKIRLNIRHALHQLIWYPELNHCLVQFWAPKRTLEGRTLLTTQFQPFALGATCDGDWRNTLCEYRMGMCREYNNCFYADAESGEEQLGLPGRVFLNKLDERAPNVEHYTLKEYPQRDLALRCKICESWALPVFEQSSHTCVGVLEIAYIFDYVYWHDKEFLGRMYDIFQEFGLRCFDGYKHCKIQDGDENKALTTAIEELNKVYESVCKNHDLPLALTWVSCRSCNHLLQSQFQFSVLDYCDEEKWDDFNCNLLKFIKDIEVCHLRKGQVAGRILSFPDLLYCSDVKQFHIDEFPLVPFARYCELGGWFTMCLQSSCTGDELYVLEFFLPKSTENKENILTKLRLILGTMEKNFKTFKLASGQGLGEVLSVEVIDFLYGQRSHSTRFIRSLDSSDQQSMDPSNKGQNAVTAEQNILVVSSSKKGKRKIQDEEHKIAGVGIEVSLEEILKCSEMRREDAAKELNVSISTLKRVCRDFGVIRWPPHNKDPRSYRPLPVENLGQTPQLNYDLPSNQASASAAHIKPSFQDSDKVTIRATCEKNTIKFRLSLSSRLVEMQQEVAKRLNLEGGTYYIKYKDEEDVLILIACDEDLQDCLHTSRSRGISSIAVLLELIK